jgi:DNA-binding MarR family transcriptional regulator
MVAVNTKVANDSWESLLGAHAALMRGFAESDVWDHASMREYDVLYTLSKCDEPQRISALRQHVLLSQPALSRLVDRLVERGLVSRCEDPADARAVHISLTEEGRKVQRTIGRTHARDVAAAMSRLTVAEMETLRDLTSKLVSTDTERTAS